MDSYSIIQNLNNSKFFAGILMILMNLGSKYISLELSETQDEFFSNSLRLISRGEVSFRLSTDFNYRPEHLVLVKTFTYQPIIPITPPIMSYGM